jgi:hypothetical protein
MAPHILLESAAQMKVVAVSPAELTKPLDVEEGERYLIIVRPRAVVCRFSGLVFDTNKNFLLPGSIPLLKALQRIYTQRPDNKLLIVGHTDTSGEVEYNDKLSLERSQAVEAFLKRDHATWLKRYETSVPESARWGDLEDRQMIGSLPAGDSDEEEPVRAFQASRQLEKVDGICGPKTREVLVKEYMTLGPEKLPDTITTTLHGCGEHFPLDATGLELDESPADGENDPVDRRVELFFFDGAIDPPPPGQNSKAGSTEYPAWRKLAKVVFDRTLGAPPLIRVVLQLEGEPLADLVYQLRVDGHLIAISRTDKNGLVSQVVPHNASEAQISVPEKKLIHVLSLKQEDQFPSVEQLSGVKIRLNQLGFFAGEENDDPTEQTDNAIASFKRSKTLADDSVLDTATRSALVAAYGS